MKGTILHIGRLLLSSLLLFVAVLTALFFLLEIAPGDPVQSLVGDSPVSDEFRAHIVAAFGLDVRHHALLVGVNDQRRVAAGTFDG